MVAGFWRAELSGECLKIEEWGKTFDDDALAFGILSSAHLCICGCKNRVRLSLDAASGAAGEGAVTGLDRFAVSVEKIIGDAQVLRCQDMGVVKSKHPFEPRQSFPEPACPHQNIPSRPIVFRVARVDLKRAIDLTQCEIVSSPVHVDVGKQSVATGCDRIERQR